MQFFVVDFSFADASWLSNVLCLLELWLLDSTIKCAVHNGTGSMNLGRLTKGPNRVISLQEELFSDKNYKQ